MLSLILFSLIAHADAPKTWTFPKDPFHAENICDWQIKNPLPQQVIMLAKLKSQAKCPGAK